MLSPGPSKPIPDEARQLTEFLHERIGDELRSVVWYDRGDYELLYARDDVLAQYSDEDVEKVIDELAVESLEKSIKEQLYTHGALKCTVQCFEDGIEMHFVIGEGEGVAVGLEPEAFIRHDTFLGKCIEEVEFAR